MFASYKIEEFIHQKLKIEGFLIHRLENLDYFPPSTVKSPHKHLFYELYLIEHGYAIHNVDFTIYHVKQNHLFFINQENVHHWEENISKKLTGYRILFTEHFLKNSFFQSNFLFELMHLYQMRYTPLIPVFLNKELYIYADLLLNEYKQEEVRIEKIRALLFLFLGEIKNNIEIDRQVVNEFSKTQLAHYKRFLETVEINYKKELSLNEYAEKVNLSTRQLSRMVKKISHTTLNKIIIERRILQAKRLLKYTNMSVSEISYEIGFKEPSYFTKVFKTRNALTPLQFRKQLKV